MSFHVDRQTFNATSSEKSLLDFEVLGCYRVVRDLINADFTLKSTDDSQSLKVTLINCKTLSTRFLFKSRAHIKIAKKNKPSQFYFLLTLFSVPLSMLDDKYYFQNKHWEWIQHSSPLFSSKKTLFPYVRKWNNFFSSPFCLGIKRGEVFRSHTFFSELSTYLDTFFYVITSTAMSSTHQTLFNAESLHKTLENFFMRASTTCIQRGKNTSASEEICPMNNTSARYCDKHCWEK